MGKEIMDRMDTVKHSCAASNSRYLKILSEIKALHEVTEEVLLIYQDAFISFARTGEEIRKRLSILKLKVKEQAVNIKGLLSRLEDQLVAMNRMEVDIDMKIRSCKGSCGNVNLYMVNMANYITWKKHLASINTKEIIQIKDFHHIHLSTLPNNVTSVAELFPIVEGKQLGLFANIQHHVLKLESRDAYNLTECSVDVSSHCNNSSLIP